MGPPQAGAAASTRLGRYNLLGKLAEGGMAEVFLAIQSGTQGFVKPVVIKKILPHLSQDSQFIHLFWNEARLAALINHPNVVSIYELGKDLPTETYYMAMEYIDGRHLKRVAKHARELERPISSSIAAHVVAQAAAGLDFAHSLRGAAQNPLNIVHRDVSPENILITYNGQVKVVDFGIAKAAHIEGKTETGRVRGKISYMSPEQITGAAIDRRTDIWALGVTLYWLLSGQKPFNGETQPQTVDRILNGEPPPLPVAVPKELQRIVAKALAKKPEERYPTAAALQAELDRYVALAAQTVNASSLAAYMNELFPEATDPDRVFAQGILSKALLQPARDAEPALPGEGLLQPLGSPGKAAAPRGAAPTKAAAPFPAVPQPPNLDLLDPTAPGQQTAPQWSFHQNRGTREKWPTSEAPPDSVHGVSIDLGTSSAPLDLDLPLDSPAAEPSPAPTLPGPEYKRGPASRPPGGLVGVLDPVMPAAEEVEEVEEDPRRVALRKQRLIRRAVTAGIALAVCVVLALAGLSIYQHFAPAERLAGMGEVGFLADTRPEGAAILLDGKPTGLVTPSWLGHWDFAGSHQLSFELADYYTGSRTVAPGLHPPNLDVPLELAAKLVVATRPPGATVRLGDETLGTTPVAVQAPSDKELRIRLELAGYLPVSKSLRLEPGQELKLDEALEPMAKLAVRSEPAGAQVELDGKLAGLTPADLSVITDVVHRLEIRVPGLPAQSRKVTVKAGKTADVRVTFEDSRDKATRAQIARIEQKLTADRFMLEKLNGGAGGARAAVYQRMRTQDDLNDEIDKLESQEQDLQGELSSHEMELVDRIKAFNLAATVAGDKPAPGAAQ